MPARSMAIARALRRPTSCTIAGTCPASSTALANSFGSMPYCRELETRNWISSSRETWTFSCSAMASSRS